MALTADNIVPQLLKLLPPGALARVSAAILRKLLLGTSDEIARLDARLEDLLIEAHPSTTDELLAQWEAEYDLPDDCVDEPQSIEQRRAAILAKLNYFGGQPLDFFSHVAESLGISPITITELLAFEVGRDGMGDGIGAQWQFVWEVAAALADIPGNRLGNIGSFESDSNADGRADGWSVYSSIAAHSIELDGLFAAKCQRITGAAGANNPRLINEPTFEPRPFVPAGRQFTISCWYRGAAGVPIILNCKGHTAAVAGAEDTQYGSAVGVIEAPGIWQRLTATFVATASGGYIGVLPGVNSVAGGHVLDIDGAQLEIAGVATPFTIGTPTARRKLLECIFRELRPAHTWVQFAFT